MKFTVEARLFGEGAYRLQEDGSWRNLGRERELQEGDRIFGKLYETTSFVFYQGELELGLEVYLVNPKLSGLGSKEAYIEAIVHREKKPRHFSREELERAIREGDDRRNNSLVLDLEGYFRLLSFEEAMRRLSPIAVRHETFIAGNDYVGREAVKDKEFIEETFLAMLGGWIRHLESGELGVYVDYVGTKGEKELWRKVEELTQFE